MLYILLNAFLIEVFPLYSIVFAYSYYRGLLLGVVLVDARECELPSLNVCLCNGTGPVIAGTSRWNTRRVNPDVYQNPHPLESTSTRIYVHQNPHLLESTPTRIHVHHNLPFSTNAVIRSIESYRRPSKTACVRAHASTTKTPDYLFTSFSIYSFSLLYITSYS